MTKPRFVLIGLLLIGGAAVPWLIQRQSNIKTINSLQTQLDQLTQQRTGDESSSNQIAQAVTPVPNDQTSELLKLRNEVNLLRKQTNELSKLRAENRQARSDLASRKHQGEPSLTAGDLVPVQSLAFAGYATPEATFQSAISSLAQGDTKFLESFMPERREKEEQDRAGKSEAELAKVTAHFAASNVQILDSRVSPDGDEAELVVYLATEFGDAEKRQKENEMVAFRMKRIAGEWKIYSEHSDHN
jgi:hypothetical protein